MTKHETSAQENSDAPVRMSVPPRAVGYADLKLIAEDKQVLHARVIRDVVSNNFDARNRMYSRNRGDTGS